LSTCSGINSYSESDCFLECNQTVALLTREYCEGIGNERFPWYVTQTRERKCYEVTQPRECCDRQMTGEVLVAKPAEGVFNHLTNTWIASTSNPYKPATAFYVRPRQTCVGYDRQHSSC
jgi:hypothetical protein